MNDYIYKENINNWKGETVGCREIKVPNSMVKQIRADAIAEMLNLPKLNHYDAYNELMYQSIKVKDIEELKEQTE